MVVQGSYELGKLHKALDQIGRDLLVADELLRDLEDSIEYLESELADVRKESESPAGE